MLQLYLTTAILGGNNNAETRQLLDILALHGVTNLAPELVLDPAAQHNWYYADLHASRSLPRHWEIVHTPTANTQASLFGIQTSDMISGIVPIGWTAASHDPTLRVFIQVSKDRGTTWREIAEGKNADSTVQWDTSLDADGAFSRVRVIAAGDTSYGDHTVMNIRVNNPGNAPPETYFTNLIDEDHLSGAVRITWIGAGNTPRFEHWLNRKVVLVK